MTPQEKALNLCQKIGASTMFTDCNEGMSLPLEISKQIAIILVDELESESYGMDERRRYRYWNEVKSEIEKL